MRIIKIGKSANNDIVIEGDNTVSRVHMQMFIDDEANAFVTDLNSMNGTFVNGVKINDPVKLNTYDILRVGNSLISWREYLSDDVNAQDAYKTIVDENNQDLLQSLDDIIDDQLPKRRKKKPYVWYVAAAVLLIGVGLFVYFNSDKQLILDKWTSKNNQELSFTFNNDGTFIKDSVGIIKKGTYQLVDGRKKKIKLSFDKASLPVFEINSSYTKSPKYAFPNFDENKRELDTDFGHVFKFKNNTDYKLSILSINQEVFKDLQNIISSKIYLSKSNYAKKISLRFDDWMYLDNKEWNNISSIDARVRNNFIPHKLNDVLLLSPGEIVSVLVLSNTYISDTYDRSAFNEVNWGNMDNNISLSDCRQIGDFEGQHFFQDIFNNWNGNIKYGIMKEKFDYSYEFVDGYLEFNGQLFKNN